VSRMWVGALQFYKTILCPAVVRCYMLVVRGSSPTGAAPQGDNSGVPGTGVRVPRFHPLRGISLSNSYGADLFRGRIDLLENTDAGPLRTWVIPILMSAPTLHVEAYLSGTEKGSEKAPVKAGGE